MIDREHVQQIAIDAVQWVRLAAELIGAGIVALGLVIAVTLFLRAIVRRTVANFTAIRLVLARYLALALEFQLGADILSTAVDPTMEQIGRLAAIAVIRTALNYFLSREMREEARQQSPERDVGRKAENG